MFSGRDCGLLPRRESTHRAELPFFAFFGDSSLLPPVAPLLSGASCTRSEDMWVPAWLALAPLCLVAAHAAEAKVNGRVAWLPSLRLIFKHSDMALTGVLRTFGC